MVAFASHPVTEHYNQPALTMGKQRPAYQRSGCNDIEAPICNKGDRCNVTDAETSRHAAIPRKESGQKQKQSDFAQDGIKELVIIGAGPHGLSLLLRLLEPDADLLSDKERHRRASYKKKMRPDRDVIQHIEKLSRGPRATLRPPGKGSRKPGRKRPGDARGAGDAIPPPLSLEEVLESVLVVDKSAGGWMSHWRENFASLGIPRLRSLMNAHADPFDHRSLEFYAERRGRRDELVTLKCLTQRDQDFFGPYQVPTTAVFNDFHELLASAYGIDGVVRTGSVLSVIPIQGGGNGSEPATRACRSSSHDSGSLGMRDRAQMLKDARGGGTIPPEILQEMMLRQEQLGPRFQVKEEAEILEVRMVDERLQVSLDDGLDCEAYDMIWLATGAEIHIDHYSSLAELREILPISVINGLPALGKDLSWQAPAGEGGDEPAWKKLARRRFWCMGALAGLELGPDALNLVGARHGSVKVAEAIRRDYDSQNKDDDTPQNEGFNGRC